MARAAAPPGGRRQRELAGLCRRLITNHSSTCRHWLDYLSSFLPTYQLIDGAGEWLVGRTAGPNEREVSSGRSPHPSVYVQTQANLISRSAYVDSIVREALGVHKQNAPIGERPINSLISLRSNSIFHTRVAEDEHAHVHTSKAGKNDEEEAH